MKPAATRVMKTLLLAAALAIPQAPAAETTEITKEAKEAAQDAKKNAKKLARKTKDETCEIVNGKVKCFKDRVKHKAQNLKDELEDATN